MLFSMLAGVLTIVSQIFPFFFFLIFSLYPKQYTEADEWCGRGGGGGCPATSTHALNLTASLE